MCKYAYKKAFNYHLDELDKTEVGELWSTHDAMMFGEEGFFDKECMNGLRKYRKGDGKRHRWSRYRVIVKKKSIKKAMEEKTIKLKEVKLRPISPGHKNIYSKPYSLAARALEALRLEQCFLNCWNYVSIWASSIWELRWEKHLGVARGK